MAAPVAGARPPAAAFAGCQYFQSDVLLRALKFLDTMLQREAAQKAAFLQDLPSLCAQFDSRVLRYLVRPPPLPWRCAALRPRRPAHPLGVEQGRALPAGGAR
jgi:hypothetical protein